MGDEPGGSPEIEEIRRKYEAGEFDPLKEDLGRFIVAHRTDIARYRDEQVRKGLPLTVEGAVKFYITRHRSINPRREIQDQLEEIRREKWIRGVRDGRAPDDQEVANDWARQHSAAWRSHRVLVIVYVFEQDKERYCRFLS